MTKIDFRLRQQCNKRTACSTVQTEFCRYTELIRLCFQHKWIASLGAVSTVLCTPLQMNQHSIRSFTSVQMVHTHTPSLFLHKLVLFCIFHVSPKLQCFPLTFKPFVVFPSIPSRLLSRLHQGNSLHLNFPPIFLWQAL